MGPIKWLGISPTELGELISRGSWARWVAAEPPLDAIDSLEELHALRGQQADAPLGALVRLAARDGGDDQLAGIAVAHQLQGGTQRLAYSMRDLSSDIDAVVMGALWAEIRSFPWRRRTHAFAASLMLDTRASVVKLLIPGYTRSGPEPVIFVDPQSSNTERLIGPAEVSSCSGPRSSCEEAALELADLLDWALMTGVIGTTDAQLLLDLTAAGDDVADQDTPQMRRGVCSQAAVQLVADQRGVCGKTVIRQRDRALTALRNASAAYFADVA